MSLDVSLTETLPTEVYCGNITHNLGEMAAAAGIYEYLWRPEEIIHSPVIHARQLIEPLSKGLEKLKSDPDKYKKYNAQNGWGEYPHFIAFLEQYLDACRVHPDAEVTASR